MSGPIDILGVGCVAVDDLVYVEDYHAADSKTQIIERQRQCGGLTATALVAAARLGARCSFAVTLGDDELSRFASVAAHDLRAPLRNIGARDDFGQEIEKLMAASVMRVDRVARSIADELGFRASQPPETWPGDET